MIHLQVLEHYQIRNLIPQFHYKNHRLVPIESINFESIVASHFINYKVNFIKINSKLEVKICFDKIQNLVNLITPKTI